MKQLDHTRFPGILFVALALTPSAAYSPGSPGSIPLPVDEFLAAQPIYPAWALLGVFILGAALATAMPLSTLRPRRRPWALASIALAFRVKVQAVLRACTFMLPDNWTNLRAQWEYSHAPGRLLDLSAFPALPFAASRRGDAPGTRF